MRKETGKGIALAVFGLAMGFGYLLYLWREVQSGVERIRVSYALLVVSLLVATVGTMNAVLGVDKTRQIMSFNTENLSRRDILIASITVLVMLAVIVAMTLFFRSHGYS